MEFRPLFRSPVMTCGVLHVLALLAFPPSSSFLLPPSQQAWPHLSAALSHLTLQKAGALASSSVQISPPQRSERHSPITRVSFLFFNLHRKCLKFYYVFLIICWLKKISSKRLIPPPPRTSVSTRGSSCPLTTLLGPQQSLSSLLWAQPYLLRPWDGRGALSHLLSFICL